MFKLTKTVSIVTGASKGIGKSIAECFARAGSHVVCVSRSEKSLKNVQEMNKNVEIGSYPFFKAGKLGVSIVLRATDQKNIDKCNLEIMSFIKEKNIEIVEKN